MKEIGSDVGTLLWARWGKPKWDSSSHIRHSSNHLFGMIEDVWWKFAERIEHSLL